MQDERVVALGFYQPGEISLLNGWVDVRVPMVLEHPEVTIEPDIDAGWLDKFGREWLDLDAARLDLGSDVSVGEQHASNLPVATNHGTGKVEA